MKLVGYTDKFSVEPGETLNFLISSEAGDYQSTLVRLIHGDDNPQGPGLKERPIEASINRSYPGTFQDVYPGSYMRIDHLPLGDAGDVIAFAAWLYPTLPQGGRQGVFSRIAPDLTEADFQLSVDEDGHLVGRYAAGGTPVEVRSPRPLIEREWQFAALVIDKAHGSFTLRVDRSRFRVGEQGTEIASTAIDGAPALSNDAITLLGACALVTDRDRQFSRDSFDGKISCPVVLSGAAVRTLLDPATRPEALDHCAPDGATFVARWNLAHDPSGKHIPDLSGNGHDGRLHNTPMRGVTGHNFDGTEDNFALAPDQYNAVHFHSDDLDDCAWDTSFEFTIPPGLGSGVYAAKLTAADGSRDYVPFFVRAPTGAPTAKVVVVIPTFSYLAYANEQVDFFKLLEGSVPPPDPSIGAEEIRYLSRYHMRSLYDVHRDGSGVCYSTMLRPLLSPMRPWHRARTWNGPHQFSADLFLIDWLEEMGIAYDVITDHDLHRHGAAALAPYKCALSGTHHEYWSIQMLEGLEQYQNAGGRFCYLSGNGLYWVTTVNAEGTVAEVRRANGGRTWSTEPGQTRHSQTGEPGGLWRFRGNGPQKYVGVGMASAGGGRGTAFRRTEDSHSPRVAFMFEGIDEELIGDIPALALEHGAAGFEIDRADFDLGTPPHALIVATSLPMGDFYVGQVEDMRISPADQFMLARLKRADMVYYETPNDGAVFSASSCNFCATLSYNNYDNNVSRLLHNVVRHFSR
ncbi:MAG: N,N-dimethylformamidase [Novosphingobium sp.]|nr:N,N-dimethylformamidase [Novosphingobium sp.]